MKTNYLLANLLVIAVIFTACKKDKATDTPSPADGSREQLTLDSIYLYAKEIYLWYDALPAYATFNPRKYAGGSDALGNFKEALFDLTQYKINPLTGKAYEYSGVAGTPKYSFLEEGSPTSGTEGRVSLNDKGDDFGLALTAISSSDIRIRYVNPGSPAAAAGLMRGNRVISINGATISSGSSGFIDAAFSQPSVSMEVRNNNGVTGTVNLLQVSYTSNPVFKQAILGSGANKTGYLAYSRFSTVSSSGPALQSVFTDFANAGVTSVIIDLRYNGGGYTQTASRLANLIAPSALNDKVMYTEYFNDLMQDGKVPILKQQQYLDADGKPVSYQGRWATYADVDYTVAGNTYKFSKEGPLQGVQQVVFIVSGNTASASELLINSLKPYMQVKLVGQQTYGKPVGFFGLKIDDYTVYLSSFHIRNASGEGEYFSGLTPDIAAGDDVTRDFGDPEEACLAAALAYLNGSSTGGRTGITVNPQHLSGTSFNGLIENRVHLR